MAGLEDELIPGPGDEDIEEERRIFYVAATRARRTLYLSFAKNRMQWGQYQTHHPSRFLKQIPENMYTGKLRSVEQNYNSSPWGMVGKPITRSGGSCSSSSAQKTENRPDWAKHISVEKKATVVKKTEPLDVQIGDMVSSPSFGRGFITKMEGAVGNRLITVKFPSGEKRLTEKYSGLKKEGSGQKKATGKTASFAVGDRVRSSMHGEGRITGIETKGVNRILTVEFGKGVIKLVEAFTKLEKI